MAALSFVTDAETAAQHGAELAQSAQGVWHVSEALLDLLSLVSDDCAMRVARIWRLSEEEAAQRRKAIARSLEQKRG